MDHITTSHPGHGHWSPELSWCNCKCFCDDLHGGYTQTTGCLPKDMIVCITAKADITQTAVEFTRWNFFCIYISPHNTYTGYVELGQISIEATLPRVSLHHRKSMCPHTGPVVTSHLSPGTGREPQGAKIQVEDEWEAGWVWADGMAGRSSVRWDAARDQPAPGTEHSAAPPHRSGKGRFPLQTCKAEQPQRHTGLTLQCAGDLSASLMSLQRTGVTSAVFPLD